jgi:hypothetical protein
MKRIESIEDYLNGVVTYELSDGRRLRCCAKAVADLGIAEILRREGLGNLLPRQRLPIMQRGRRVGTVAPDFDSLAIKSRSFLYDPRPGDFIRDGNVWIASPTLGPGDFECIPGFQREPTHPAQNTETK